MALLVTYPTALTGLPTGWAFSNAAVAGDEFFNVTPSTVLFIVATSTQTLTIVPANPPLGLALAGVAYTAASGIHMIGPFPPEWFNDGNDRITVTYSAVVGLTLTTLRFG